MYEIELVRSAVKEYEDLPSSFRKPVSVAIDKLAADPRPDGVKKLKGFDKYYRIRAGDYRVIYVIDDDTHTVTITRIRHRKDAYE